MLHRTAGWISLLLAMVGCGGGKQVTFRDVQKGRIPLATAEIAAIEALLADADQRPGELRVDSYGGLEIVDGHAVGLSLRGPVTDLGPVADLAELRRLELYDAEPSDLSPVAGHPRLEALLLRHSEVTDLSGLSPCGLKSIELGGRALHGLAPLAGCGALERLVLYLAGPELLATFPELPSLSELVLESSDPGEAGLAFLASAPGLETLRLHGEAARRAGSLPTLERLAELDLSNASIDGGLELPPLPSLRRLHGLRLRTERLELPVLPALEEIELTEGELRQLVMPPQPSLVTADLSDNRLESLDVEPQPVLRRLDLRDNEKLASLDALAGSPQLDVVDVHGTRIGLLPPDLEARGVTLRADSGELERNAVLQQLIRDFEAREDSWVEVIPPPRRGELRHREGSCRSSSSIHGRTDLSCDWRIAAVEGTVHLAPISGDVLESMKHGEPVTVTATLSVERGVARIYFKEDVDLQAIADGLAGYREDGPLISISYGAEPSETYRSGYRFVEARPGQPGTVQGTLYWLAGDAVFWLAAVDGRAEGVRIVLES